MKENSVVASPLNYTGGKVKLLPQILPLFPDNIDTFVDLFCGGCNVGINVKANNYIYNDINPFVIDFYNFLKTIDKNAFISSVNNLIKQYGLSQSCIYGYDKYNCNSSEGLGKYNKDKFISLRKDFNNSKIKNDTYFAMFYTLIVFSFNNQIRFNSKGEYNLPVGKRDFNEKMQKKLSAFIDTIKKQNPCFVCKDFSEIKTGDFVYADPPYLISTASYNENGGWTEKDEKRLLSYLSYLNDNSIRFALSNVLCHKGKENCLLAEWCEKNKEKIKVFHLNYNYNNSNYQSKQTKTDEVLIVNC